MTRTQTDTRLGEERLSVLSFEIENEGGVGRVSFGRTHVMLDHLSFRREGDVATHSQRKIFWYASTVLMKSYPRTPIGNART